MPFPSSYLRLSRQIHRSISDLDGTLRGLCFAGRLPEAIAILCRNASQVDRQTYAFLLQECVNLGDLNQGRRVHAQMVTMGFSPDLYLMTKLIILYAKCGDLETARYLFDKIGQRSLVSWNAMISGCMRKGLEAEALSMYYEMRWGGLKPDQFTFSSVFRACASLASLEQGKVVHGVMIKSQDKVNVVVHGALVDMYFKCSSLHEGRQVFEQLSERNVIMWTLLISGYGQHGQVEEVVKLFDKMVEGGIRPNYVTFLVVISACSRGGLVDEGIKYFSSMMSDYDIRPRGEHIAAMVDLFGRSGRLTDAFDFVTRFSCGEHPVIWGALMGACRVHGNLELLKIAAKKFFELEPGNVGKYVVLSNTYASLGLWEYVSELRDMMSVTGMKKEPGCSWLELQGEVHFFLVGDKSHKLVHAIYELMELLDLTLKEANYIPDIHTSLDKTKCRQYDAVVSCYSQDIKLLYSYNGDEALNSQPGFVSP